jgi:hypothetical protein
MELVAVHDLLEDKDTVVDLCIQILNWEWPRSDTIRRRGLLSSSPGLPMNLVLIQRFPRSPAPAVLGHARIRCLGIYLQGDVLQGTPYGDWSILAGFRYRIYYMRIRFQHF